MSSHLNEYLVATNSIDRHRPQLCRQPHHGPRAPWRVRLRRHRHALLADTAAAAGTFR